jgi:hypothetical protein
MPERQKEMSKYLRPENPYQKQLIHFADAGEFFVVACVEPA